MGLNSMVLCAILAQFTMDVFTLIYIVHMCAHVHLQIKDNLI